jgi:hypothetical protein
MDGVQEIDIVLQYVRQATRRLRVPVDTAITQQVLLFGDSFYGYRFTTPDVTAIWSAADQMLKIFDPYGRVLESFAVPESVDQTIPFTTPQRKAA